MSRTDYSIKNLLEAGAHFGHQTIHWNPKMSRYVFMKRRGIHIIDLQKTVLYLEKACNQLKNITTQGGKVLFVGTKRQIKEIVKLKVENTGQYYMIQRWIGGLLTNYQVVSKSIQRLREYNEILEDESKQEEYTKNQLVKMRKERNKLHELYCGVVGMDKLPEAIFIVDIFCEKNAALEAKALGIPIFSIVDTNGDPDYVDVIIPGNDDAIRSVGLFLDYVVEAIQEGSEIYKRKRMEEDLFAEQIKKEDELKKVQEESEENSDNKNMGDEKGDKLESKTDMKDKPNSSEKPKMEEQNKPVKKSNTVVSVSAKDVKNLRDLTDVSMMECKKALVQARGNKEEAIKILKERGMAVAAKRADRETHEGVVFVKTSGKDSWMANICCETDFVAKSEHFSALVKVVEKDFIRKGPDYFKGDDFQKLLTETTSKTGEKMAVSDVLYLQADKGKFFTYLHANHKVGVVLGLESDDPSILNNPDVQELGKDLCLQVAAMNPVAVSMDRVSSETIEEQKQVFLKQMKEDDKPAEIKEKILEGKIKKYFSELCLMDMEFVKENGKSVKTLIDEISKKVGSPIRVFQFQRNYIGS